MKYNLQWLYFPEKERRRWLEGREPSTARPGHIEASSWRFRRPPLGNMPDRCDTLAVGRKKRSNTSP
jgi:hypothetical protein